jgi:hypothetical protein
MLHAQWSDHYAAPLLSFGRVQVKFRDQNQLQDLRARVQSGGERSVSTILYLMGLQVRFYMPQPYIYKISYRLGMSVICCEKTVELFLMPTFFEAIWLTHTASVCELLTGPDGQPLPRG